MRGEIDISVRRLSEFYEERATRRWIVPIEITTNISAVRTRRRFIAQFHSATFLHEKRSNKTCPVPEISKLFFQRYRRRSIHLACRYTKRMLLVAFERLLTHQERRGNKTRIETFRFQIQHSFGLRSMRKSHNRSIPLSGSLKHIRGMIFHAN